MATFSADTSAALEGPGWLVERRASAFEQWAGLSQPTEAAEVWRYSPIDRLELDAYGPASSSNSTPWIASALSLAAEFSPAATAIFDCGRVVRLDRGQLPQGVVFGPASQMDVAPGLLGRVMSDDDFFVALNDAFAPDVVVLDVPPRLRVEKPIVIVHWCAPSGTDGRGPTSFPRTIVALGEGAQAQVVEVHTGPAGLASAMVVPVTEFEVGDRARLCHVALQDLPASVWHVSRAAAVVGSDGSLRSFTAGLGADYDRGRFSAAAIGRGASTQLTTLYLGSGNQVHDVRTLQDHVSPRTTSDLLCKGAVAERSRSIYTGLIRVRNGATRSEAMQTNQNLVLGAGAHADSVPNLDIEENDVRCSHASSVGPVDEDQRYYLESRGLSPQQAERLIVLGFFDDVVERSPVRETLGVLRARIGRRLTRVLSQYQGGSDV